MEPSVRGSLFVTGVVAVRRHRESGAISEEELAARLGPAALELLDQKIDIDHWYPIRAFTEMVDMDWELAARAPDYMREKGEDAAARFFRTGIYQQLDYAKRVRRPDDRPSLLRQAKLIVSVAESLYSFLEVRVQEQRDALEIIYGNAKLFSEALRYSTEGFMNEVNRMQGAVRKWASERVAPGRVCFRLELPEWLRGSD